MASVGVLAAVVNIIALLIVAIVDRVIELVVRNFAASRLRKERRAPVVHDSDTWLPNIPRSMVKYHRHPAILLTVMGALLLIASEVITELGVDVSNNCSPEMKSGEVITNGDSINSFTEIELAAAAFFLQTITFLDGELTRIPSGLPRSIKGTECIVCMNPEVHPDLMNGCTISDDRIYEPGQLSVTILTTTGPFKTITDQMTEIGEAGRTFSGRGDLTFNGNYYSAFYFYTSEDSDLIYLEYSNQEHLDELVDAARKRPSEPSPGAIRSRVTAKRIKCATNKLSSDNFRNANSIYRTIQLENTINPAMFIEEDQAFKSLTVDGVYRAGLSVKIIDDPLTIGEYYQYTSCGTYKWQFLLPFIICTVWIFLLFIISMVAGHGFDAWRVPYNSRTWFRQSHNRAGITAKGPVPAARSGYFSTIFDEMVVLEEGTGAGTGVKFGLRSRDGRIAPMASSSRNFGCMCSYNSNVQLENGMGAGEVMLAPNYLVPSDLTDGAAAEVMTPEEYDSVRW